MMKLTTLLHGVDPLVFRKTVFRAVLKMFLPLMLMLLVLTILLEFAAGTGLRNFAILYTVVLFLLLPFLIARSSSKPKAILQNNKLVFSRKRLIEFDDEGMMIRFDSGSYSFTKWTDLEEAKYQDGLVTLHLSKLYVHLIPDSAWPSTVERDQFLILLRSKALLK